MERGRVGGIAADVITYNWVIISECYTIYTLLLYYGIPFLFIYYIWKYCIQTIAAVIVGSRLDFCNSLLAGISVSNLVRLQRVQNTLARVVAQKPWFCHITPVFSDLHWLPVRHRISFKIATVTFRVLQFQQPSMHLSSQDMYRREHSALLRLCQYVFHHVKPPWQPPNHFHLLLRISEMHSQIICRPFQLFLLLEELSNITYYSLLTLKIVQNLARSNQLKVVSHFVIQCHLYCHRTAQKYHAAHLKAFHLSAYD